MLSQTAVATFRCQQNLLMEGLSQKLLRPKPARCTTHSESPSAEVFTDKHLSSGKSRSCTLQVEPGTCLRAPLTFSGRPDLPYPS